MNEAPSPARVPTLTEIVELAEREADVPVAEMPVLTDAVAEAPTAAGDALQLDRVVDEVMAEVQRRMDLMFEYRLREALAPALARAADQLVGEAREALASTLRDVVARAVAQEIARRRHGS